VADVGNDGDDDGLVTVRLIDLPVALHAQASEHSDELMREFTYLRAQSVDPDAPNVPSRLLDLVDELTGDYSGFTVGTQAELDGAIAEQRASIDLEYRVPSSVGPACVHLGELLDAADRYCREGEHLLTLATPDELVAYRRWFLEEFIRQAAGQAPRPWGARTELSRDG
jgi:hypothetical protein